MSQQRGSGGEVARGAGYAALLGAMLIGVAVIIGVVLLQIGDRNTNGLPAKSHTTTSKPKTHTPTTRHRRGGITPHTGPVKAPSAVSVVVLNGGAPSGQAGRVSEALKLKGYTSQPNSANTWQGHHQTGTTVDCRSGLRREGNALVAALGSNAVLHVPFPSPAPPYSSGLDCAVIVGA